MFDTEGDAAPERDAWYVRARVMEDGDKYLGVWAGYIDGLTWRTKVPTEMEPSNRFFRAAAHVLARMIEEQAHEEGMPTEWSLYAREVMLPAARIFEQAPREASDEPWDPWDLLSEFEASPST